MSSYSTYTAIKIPNTFSRQKAVQFVKNRSEEGPVTPSPEKETISAMYEMYIKIGAIDELPSDPKLTQEYLTSLWTDLFYENHLVPADIPGDIVISEFTRAVVSGRANRKGNNMAAIIASFNQWIVKQDVRSGLYSKRDQYYPGQQPKALPPSNGFSANTDEAEMDRLIRGKKLEDWPTEVLIQQAQTIAMLWDTSMGKQVKALGVNAYRSRLYAELNRRGITETETTINHDKKSKTTT